MALEITRYTMFGQRTPIDVHNLPINGTLAHKLESRDLYRALKKLGIDSISQNSGHQDMLWAYGLWLRKTNPNVTRPIWEVDPRTV
jgi:hypothetical protein